MFGLESRSQEVSSNLSLSELLCGNSGAALSVPKFPCEYIYLDVPSKLGSSLITPLKQPAPPVFCHSPLYQHVFCIISPSPQITLNSASPLP